MTSWTTSTEPKENRLILIKDINEKVGEVRQLEKSQLWDASAWVKEIKQGKSLRLK